MLDIRPITEDEVEAFRDCLMATFGSDREDDPEGPARVRALLEPGRAFGAFDGGTMVATAGTFTLTMGVPGGAMAVAGLTMASVRPTHRRRGILRALIRLHLEDARRRGEAVSGLWASEATIYGRFGYGIAAESDVVEVDTRGLAISRGEDTMMPVDERAARAALPAIYARATAGRPGALQRSDVWWRERRFQEVPFARRGASRQRFAIARRGGEAVGYVVVRQRPGFTDGVPSGVTEIVELIAIDEVAEASLWKFVVGIDLFPKARWWNAPTDSVLPWIASDARRVLRRRTDSIWLRIDDVGAALAARRYAADGALRFAVGEACWELTVEQGRGSCVRVEAAPELRFAPEALGSVFMGSVAPSVLARAGRITGEASAIAQADRLLVWPVAAWCPEIF